MKIKANSYIVKNNCVIVMDTVSLLLVLESSKCLEVGVP